MTVVDVQRCHPDMHSTITFATSHCVQDTGFAAVDRHARAAEFATAMLITWIPETTWFPRVVRVA